MGCQLAIGAFRQGPSHRNRAGTGAASQRHPAAPLPRAHGHLGRPMDLDEVNVDPPRKPLVMFQQRADRFQRHIQIAQRQQTIAMGGNQWKFYKEEYAKYFGVTLPDPPIGFPDEARMDQALGLIRPS